MALSEEKKTFIRGIIVMFTAERPMIVNVATYAILEHEGLVPDERVIVQRKIPGEFITCVNGYSI